jgi:hypothetical protein
VVVIALIAVVSAIIIPMIADMRVTSRTMTEVRNIQLWNATYTDACTANSDLSAINSWNNISTLLAAGVTANVGNEAVTFACPVPQFINAGEPTFVPGRGITAAP